MDDNENDELEIDVKKPKAIDKNEEGLMVGKSLQDMIVESNLRYIKYHFWGKVTITIFLSILLFFDLRWLHCLFYKVFAPHFIVNSYNCSLLQTLIVTSTLTCGALTAAIATIALNKSTIPLNGNGSESEKKKD